MLRSVAVVAFGLIALLTSAPVEAGPAAEVRALYERFYTAQNARDLDAVRGFFLADDRFLWVSDGKSFYGPDAVLERMASFQRAEVWEVRPELDAAAAVEVAPGVAYLHLPLILRIGAAAAPAELPFLVSVLGVDTPTGWRIAALFTTDDKRR